MLCFKCTVVPNLEARGSCASGYGLLDSRISGYMWMIILTSQPSYIEWTKSFTNLFWGRGPWNFELVN
jgi:hypothetical protein